MHNLQIYCGEYPLLGNDLETMKQHSLLGNKFVIGKYAHLLLGNDFANRHVSTETIRVKY
jgi:hypothetical protein